jgi:hypothetical protein
MTVILIERMTFRKHVAYHLSTSTSQDENFLPDKLNSLFVKHFAKAQFSTSTKQFNVVS